MEAFTRHRRSRDMTSSTVYHVFLISWIHCIIVIFCSVTMATQSTDGASANGIFNVSSMNERENVKSLDTFFTILNVPCPPLNNLHFVCDHSISAFSSTCEERALIIQKCLHQFPGLYNNSPWSFCLLDDYKCEAVSNVLRDNDFINKPSDNEKPAIVTTVSISTSLFTSGSIYSQSSTHSSESTSNSTSSNSSGVPAPSTSITSSSETTSGSSASVSPMDEAFKTPSSEEGGLDTISYIYPIIGAFLIAFEIVMLCVFSCYKKKREQNANAGSLVLQEEVIEPVTSSPTKAALHPNSVYDEDSVLSEDKTIYKSYINLKYIDDTSAESTPEKALMRT